MRPPAVEKCNSLTAVRELRKGCNHGLQNFQRNVSGKALAVDERNWLTRFIAG